MDNTNSEQINPILLAFLEAETMEEKERVLIVNAHDIDMHILLSMAASMDFVIDDKLDADSALYQLRTLIKTRAHFENSRLR